MYIIPPNLFEKQKPFILIEILFCDRNENKSTDFTQKKIYEFTNNKFKISIKSITKKLVRLYKSKNKNMYPSWEFIKGIAYVETNILAK